MQIKHREADQFLSRGLQGLFFFLFFGTDEGLIHERAYTLYSLFKKNNPNSERIDIDGDDLAQQPHILYEQAQSIGLFAEQKAILIMAGSKSFTPALEVCVEDDIFQTPVIIKAGSLRPDHQLRKLFERHKKMASIECYPDSPQDISSLIKKTAQEHKSTISADAIDHLIHALGESRLSTRLELDKLFLYKYGDEQIDLHDILAISSDASDPLIDELTGSVFMRNRTQAVNDLTRLLNSGHDPNMIIGHLLRFSQIILKTKINISQGDQPEIAGQKAMRSLGIFSRPQKIDAYTRKWTEERLIKAILLFSQCMDRIRLEPKLASTYIARVVMAAAH
jgi:DNA polymerase III subunit delta